MEYLIEFILDLVVESGIELLPNKKIPKWIRYIIGLVILLLFLTIIIGLIILGIMLIKKSLAAAIIIILVGVILLIGTIIKFIEVKQKM